MIWGQIWPNSLDDALRRLLQIILLATLAVIPWHYGTVTWIDQTVLAGVGLIVGSLTGILIWRCGAPRLPRVVWAMAGILILGLLQIVPLPRSLWMAATVGGAFEQQVAEESEWFLEHLDAADGENLELHDRGPASWSIHPLQTRATLASMAVVVVFLLASACSFRSRRAGIALFGTLAVVGFCHAFVGVLQAVAWNRWTLLEMPSPSYFGTFVSRNTAPQFYGIGGGAALSLLVLWSSRYSSRKQATKYHVRYPAVNFLARMRRRAEELISEMDAGSVIGVFVLVFMLVAVFGATSRGGVLAWIGAAIITLIYALSRDRVLARYAIFAVIVVAVASIFITTLELDDTTLQRLGTVMDEAGSENNARYRIWLDALSAPNWWWLGSGAGTFHFMIIPQMSLVGTWPYHAESIYVETLACFGIPGAGLLVWGLLGLLTEMRRERRRSYHPWRIGMVFTLSTICLQSLVDFSLIIPAVSISLAVMLGAWYTIDRDSGGSNHPTDGVRSQQTSAAGTLSLGLVLIVSWGIGIAPLWHFARAETWKRAADRQETLIEVRAPISPFPEESVQAGRIVQRNAELLAQRLDWPPELAESKERLSDAIILSAAFRAPADSWLLAVKSVIQADPDIRKELDMSMDLFPPAVAACPLDWRAAWGIARGDCGEMSTELRARNLARLELLGRFLPSLQMQTGIVALWSGDREIGIRFLTLAVDKAPDAMYRLVPLLEESLTADEAAEILHDHPLRILALAQRLGSKQEVVQQQLIAKVAADEAVAHAVDAADWRLVAWYARQMSDDELSIQALREVAKLSPQDHVARFELAKLLEAAGEIEEAIRWMRQAERRSDRNAAYRTYREHLEQRQQEQHLQGDGHPAIER